MGLLRSVVPDRRILLQEIEDFRSFLAGNPRAERAGFLPFFAARDQLCAYLAMSFLLADCSSALSIALDPQLVPAGSSARRSTLRWSWRR